MSNHSWVACAAMAAVCALAPRARGDLPLVSGNYDIASRIMHGDAHLAIIGDSLQNSKQINAYLQRWNPDRFSGTVMTAMPSAVDDIGWYPFPWFTQTWVQSSTNRAPNSPPADDGYTAVSQAPTQHIVFSGGTVAPAGSLYENRVFSFVETLGQDLYRNGSWLYGNAGNITADVLVYATPGGLASGLQAVVPESLTVARASIDISAQAATPQLTKYSMSFQVPVAAQDQEIGIELRVKDGTAIPANSNFVVVGARVSTGLSGLQVANLAQGSMGVDHFLDPTRVSDENLARFIEYTDTNIAYIWIGANDQGAYNGPAYKAKMQELIARYKTARSDMQFVLVSTYDLGSPLLLDYAQALYEISLEDSSVLFLNLYGAAGDFSTLDSLYLSDHVHQNAAGSIYFADKVWGLTEQAAAMAPEPSVAGVIALAALAMLRRHRRRAGTVQ